MISFFYGLLDGGDDIYSWLTFVGVNCEGAVFLNGIAPQQIWFEVRSIIHFKFRVYSSVMKILIPLILFFIFLLIFIFR